MNRRSFVKGSLVAAASTALPLSITSPAQAGILMRRRVVKSFRPLGALAPQFAARFEGHSLDIVRRLYKGLLRESPPLKDLYWAARGWEQNPTATLRWFLRQPALKGLTPVGLDRVQYPPRFAPTAPRHIAVALERCAAIQRLWLASGGRLPTPVELGTTFCQLLTVRTASQHLVQVPMAYLARAHADTVMSFNTDGTISTANDTFSTLAAVLSIEGIVGALATIEGGAALAATGGALLSEGLTAGTIGVAVTSFGAGAVVSLVGLGMIALGVFAIVIILDQVVLPALGVPPSLALRPNDDPPAAPPSGGPGQPDAPPSAPPDAPPDFGVGINIDISITAPDNSTTTSPDAPDGPDGDSGSDGDGGDGGDGGGDGGDF